MTHQLHVGATRLTFDPPAGRGELKTAGFIFQHGMGGDTAQPLGYLGDTPPVPVAALSARGHAPSDDITDPAKVNWRGSAAEASFDTFADDVIALADHLGLDRFAIGGISLGAGTALNLTLRHPDRVTALVLCRPAWLDQPQADFNQAAYRGIADLTHDRTGQRLLVPVSGQSRSASPTSASTMRREYSSAIRRASASASTDPLAQFVRIRSSRSRICVSKSSRAARRASSFAFRTARTAVSTIRRSSSTTIPTSSSVVPTLPSTPAT